MKVIKYIILTVYLIIGSCQTEKPPQAEIMKVYNVRDNSAQINILVAQQPVDGGNAEFLLIISATTGNYSQSISLPSYSIPNKLMVTVSGLSSQTTYQANMSFTADVVGGPNYSNTYHVGKTKYFTTQ